MFLKTTGVRGLRKRKKGKFTLFGNYNGSLLRQQPGASGV